MWGQSWDVSGLRREESKRASANDREARGVDRLASDEADVIEPWRKAVGGQGGRVAPAGVNHSTYVSRADVGPPGSIAHY